MTFGQIWRIKNPFFGALLTFLPILVPKLAPKHFKWNILHPAHVHACLPDIMSWYLTHLMHKKGQNMHFLANLALKMAFWALFSPFMGQKHVGWSWNGLPSVMPVQPVHMTVCLALTDQQVANFWAKKGPKKAKKWFFFVFSHFACKNGIWVKFSQKVKDAQVSDGQFGTQIGTLGLAVGAFGALPPLTSLPRQMRTGKFGAPKTTYFFPACLPATLLLWGGVIWVSGFCATAKKHLCRIFPL